MLLIINFRKILFRRFILVFYIYGVYLLFMNIYFYFGGNRWFLLKIGKIGVKRGVFDMDFDLI
jgi:hypothetical protein